MEEDDIAGPDDIFQKILQNSDYSEQDLEAEVDKKKAEYDMLTEEGALTLIANELGITLGEETQTPTMKIRDLEPGAKEIDIVGKVMEINEPKGFTRKDGSKGFVCGLILSDDTASVRLTLWDQECRTLDEVEIGDAVRIVGGICKSGRRGKEIHTGRRARLMLNPSVAEDPRMQDLDDVKEAVKPSSERRRISDLDAGKSNIEVRATVVKLYRLWVYDACPRCGRKVSDGECQRCGEVEAEPRSILDIGVDDSSGFVHAKFFGEIAGEILGVSPSEARRGMRSLIEQGMDDTRAAREYLHREHGDLLGKELILSGRVDSDEYRGIVFSVSEVDHPDPVAEAKRVLEEVKAVVE